MAYTTSKRILTDAQAGGYAVGAFNVENMEMVLAVLSAAETLKSPVILQTTPSTLKYATPEIFASMIKAAVEAVSVPVCLHLDHGNSYELAVRAINAGYSSVMIDGSALAFDGNISLTRSVVEIAHAEGVPVEAELGAIGGKEDSLESLGGAYTDPSDARHFADETGIDSLAVAIGTAHGIYKSTPKVDVGRLSTIRETVSVPLVLHGTSGVPDETVKDCIKCGICKVNYATDLRLAYTAGVRGFLDDNPDAFDPKKYGTAGKSRVEDYVKNRILLLGSSGKA